MDERVANILNDLLAVSTQIIDPVLPGKTPRYPLKYVSPGVPPSDCSLLVVYWATGPTGRPATVRTSGVVYEINIRVRLANCCVPGPKLEDGGFLWPAPDVVTAFTNAFDKDALTLWSELNFRKKELFGRYGLRCDDAVDLVRPDEPSGLCFWNEVVFNVPIIPRVQC